MHVISHLVGRLAGDKASMVEFVSSDIDRRKDDPGYEAASGLGRMMIARIVMCWLRVVEAESCLMQIGRGGQSLKHCEFAERSLTRANSRFLKACEALSRYRLLTQAARFATARANLIAARAAEVKDKARHDEEPQQPAALALVRETA